MSRREQNPYTAKLNAARKVALRAAAVAYCHASEMQGFTVTVAASLAASQFGVSAGSVLRWRTMVMGAYSYQWAALLADQRPVRHDK